METRIATDQVIEMSSKHIEAAYQPVPVMVNSWGKECMVTPTLTLVQASSFVDMVISSCTNNDAGEYDPSLFDFYYKFSVISFYTNIDMPTGYSDAYNIIYATDLYDCVINAINHDQLEVITRALSDKIRMLISMNTSYIAHQVMDTSKMMDKINEQFANIISEIDISAINEFAEFIKNNGIDEGKIAKALLKSEG